METIVARSSGIDMQQAQSLVVFHLQYVRVSADEQFGRMDKQAATDRSVVVSRITANVLDEHVGSLDGEAVDLWVAQADVASVDIAVYGAEGAEGFELLGYLERTDVAGMPHLIALGKVPCVAFVPMAVGVRE